MKTSLNINRSLGFTLSIIVVIVVGFLLLDSSHAPTLTAAPDLQAATPTPRFLPTQASPYPLPPAPATPTPRRNNNAPIINAATTPLAAYPLPQNTPTNTPIGTTPRSSPTAYDEYIVTYNGVTRTLRFLSSSTPLTSTSSIKPPAAPKAHRSFPPPSQILQRTTAACAVATPVDPTLVDNWRTCLNETNPPNNCAVYYNNTDSSVRYWGPTNYTSVSAPTSAWPAAGGTNALDPFYNNYSAGLRTTIWCGPYDLSNVQKAMVQFSLASDLNDPYINNSDSGDSLIFAMTTDCANANAQWDEWEYDFDSGGWKRQIYWMYRNSGTFGSQVCFRWSFGSDADAITFKGIFLDNLSILGYNTPSYACNSDNPDPIKGKKGVVLDPYDPTASGEYIMVRDGDTIAARNLQFSNAGWVRLLFRQRHVGEPVDRVGYDRMVDTLCKLGMSVLGVINHESITRRDFNNLDPAVASIYRIEFGAQAYALSQHYNSRIKYWEIWNEPNLDGAPPNKGAPYIWPELYAPLLIEARAAIIQVNSANKIVFGGLGSAWGDSLTYLQNVYASLDGLGNARPFDYLSIHPYAKPQFGLDPQAYLHANDLSEMNPGLGDQNILGKFARQMQFRNHIRDIWATEIGWNSAKGKPTAEGCTAINGTLVTEAQQATYLKRGFDVLFNERPNVNISSDVKKIFWYQYMDLGQAIDCGTNANAMTWKAQGTAGSSFNRTNATTVEWEFGLFRGDKQTPKPSWCAFAAYPNPCRVIVLPLVIR